MELVIDNPLVLYVLMRTDLPDYLPGKSMAQANHAGTRFMRDMALQERSETATEVLFADFDEWLRMADGFGTCVVLGVTRRQLHQRLTIAGGDLRSHVMSGLVHDPSYPIWDGDQVLTLPVDTCGYVFGRKQSCYPATIDLPLFRDKG